MVKSSFALRGQLIALLLIVGCGGASSGVGLNEYLAAIDSLEECLLAEPRIESLVIEGIEQYPIEGERDGRALTFSVAEVDGDAAGERYDRCYNERLAETERSYIFNE